MVTIFKNKKKIYICSILLIIIVLQLLHLFYTFTVKKSGEHSDEVWSYGLANSHNMPYIFADNTRVHDDVKLNKWITGQDLNNYITVQPSQRFDYKNVISNLKYDEHPPLYFMILHTICSFFPDTYSKWFAFPINIICFVLTMIVLFLLVKKAIGNDIHGLLCVLYFGFCTGGVSLYIFNRHYAMAAMFFLMLYYFHFRLLESPDNNVFYKRLIPVFIISMLGMLTLYLSALASCILAAFCCIRLLGQKKIKKLFAYAGTMLISTLPMIFLSGIFSDKITINGFTSTSLSDKLDANNKTFGEMFSDYLII